MATDVRRLYKLSYRADKEPVYFEDLGNVVKMAGVLLCGKDTNICLLVPGQDAGSMGSMLDATIVEPTLSEWSELMRHWDDPKVLVCDTTEAGRIIKAIFRKVERSISGAVQQRIWVRDDLRCMYCGRAMGKIQLTVDHFIPLEQGGENCEGNYISACRKCNKDKGNMSPSDYCVAKNLDYSGLVCYLEGTMTAMWIEHLG